jgi:hypothetical protein
MGIDFDSDIEDLIRENIKLTKENNKLLKKMRRGHIYSILFRVLFFLIISGASWYVYKNYVEEYYLQIQNMYEGVQQNVNSLKDIPAKLHL